MATEVGVSGMMSAGVGKSQHEAMAAVMARTLATAGSTATTAPPCRREKRAEGVSSEKPKSQRKRIKLKKRNTEEEEPSEHSGSDEGIGSDSGSAYVHSRPPLTDVVMQCHRPPLDWNVDEERLLQRMATRGVVQLFNAVSKQQKIIERKTKAAGASERKRTKVLKSIDKDSFIDMLRTDRAGDRERFTKNAGMTKEEKIVDQTKKYHSLSSTLILSGGGQEQGPAPDWDVLKDGYIMKSGVAAGSAMLDWEEEGERDSSSLEDSHFSSDCLHEEEDT